MKRTAAFLVLMTMSSMLHAACVIPPSLWDWPRSGKSMLSLKEIKPCVAAYLADSRSDIVIHHGKDVDSALHADELRAWLISLAVSPARIHDAADLPAGLSIENLKH